MKASMGVPGSPSVPALTAARGNAHAVGPDSSTLRSLSKEAGSHAGVQVCVLGRSPIQHPVVPDRAFAWDSY